MSASSKSPIEQIVYPESQFGGFTRWDGTVQFYSRVRAVVPDKAVILDIGCGRGSGMDDACAFRRDIRNLRGTGRHVIGIDVDPAGHSNPTLDEFRQIPRSGTWPVEDAAIDVAFCDFVLEHIEHPDDFFSQWHRVLKPGGFACLRTPNSSSYIVLISRLIPNRFHGKVTRFAQDGRKAEDVFPTFYRCNTRRKLARLFHKHHFQPCIYSVESEPNYLRFSRLVYRVGAAIHRYLPQRFQSTLLGFARKLP
jgi:SAM-dependent methyltransferase